MQEKDNIEELYGKAFSEYEAPPPEKAWEKIRSGLQPPAEKAGGPAARLARMFRGLRHSRNLYPLLASAAMILLLFVIWFSYSHKHCIRGHAYAGESRICKGTAYLFRVYDKSKPLDTVLMIGSVPVDDNGFYQFSGVGNGNYLIRINPLPGSETTWKYLPSFYDQDSLRSEANIIRVDQDDPTVDIRLIPK